MLERVLVAVMIAVLPVGVFCIGGYAWLAYKHHSLFEGVGSVLLATTLLHFASAFFVSRKDMQAEPYPAPCEVQQPQRLRSVARSIAKKGDGK